MKKLLSLSAFVSWLNSLTTTELHSEFPGSFHKLKASDSTNQGVTKLFANDAILWRFVKEYNQFLLQPLKPEMFEGETKLFANGDLSINKNGNQYYELGWNIIAVNYKGNNPDCFNGKTVGYLTSYNVELTKPINELIL